MDAFARFGNAGNVGRVIFLRARGGTCRNFRGCIVRDLVGCQLRVGRYTPHPTISLLMSYPFPLLIYRFSLYRRTPLPPDASWPATVRRINPPSFDREEGKRVEFLAVFCPASKKTKLRFDRNL